VSLLRAHSAEHLLLSAAYRSLAYNDVVLLGNDTVLSRGTPAADPAVARLVARVIDDVIGVLRDVSVDDVEVACLKAIIFFDPGQWSQVQLSFCCCFFGLNFILCLVDGRFQAITCARSGARSFAAPHSSPFL